MRRQRVVGAAEDVLLQRQRPRRPPRSSGRPRRGPSTGVTRAEHLVGIAAELRQASAASPRSACSTAPGRRIEQRHAPARRGDDLRDAAAHLARADDEHVLEAGSRKAVEQLDVAAIAQQRRRPRRAAPSEPRPPRWRAPPRHRPSSGSSAPPCCARRRRRTERDRAPHPARRRGPSPPRPRAGRPPPTTRPRRASPSGASSRRRPVDARAGHGRRARRSRRRRARSRYPGREDSASSVFPRARDRRGVVPRPGRMVERVGDDRAAAHRQTSTSSASP